MKGIKKLLVIVLIAVLTTMQLTMTVLAEEALYTLGEFTVGTECSLDVDFTYDSTSHILTIKNSGSYSIAMKGGESTGGIVVESGTDVDLTLNNVNINKSATGGCAFCMDGATVRLALEGINSLTSSGNYAGLQCSSNASSQLTIYGHGALSAKGGANGPGIGGDYINVIINSGTVTAESSSCGAGIGGFDIENITINGGTVTATSTNGAGIGGFGMSSTFASLNSNGTGPNGSITINGGTVAATSSYGAGIGGGGNDGGPCSPTTSRGHGTGESGRIIINGGTVTATSYCGAGIGGSGSKGGLPGGRAGNGTGKLGSISINGGVVSAQSSHGAAIGGGTIVPMSNQTPNYGGDGTGYGGLITINGGTVKATSVRGHLYQTSAADIGGGSVHSISSDSGMGTTLFYGKYCGDFGAIRVNGGSLYRDYPQNSNPRFGGGGYKNTVTVTGGSSNTPLNYHILVPFGAAKGEVMCSLSLIGWDHGIGGIQVNEYGSINLLLPANKQIIQFQTTDGAVIPTVKTFRPDSPILTSIAGGTWEVSKAPFAIKGSRSGYTYENGVLTFTAAGDYEVSMDEGAGAAADRIVVRAGTPEAPVNLTLKNINIDASASINTPCALDMTEAVVNLTLKGSNILKSGNGYAGLQCPSGTKLTIGGSGMLSAQGGSGGAGIGGGENSHGGVITVFGGTINSQGGSSGAGIGGGANGSGSTTYISGGSVYAKGENGAENIGKGAMGTNRGILMNKPEAEGGSSIYLTTIMLSDASGTAIKNTAVSSLTTDAGYTYGTEGIHTDIDGNLYLYLPDGTQITAAQTTNEAAPPVLNDYFGNITTSNDGLAKGQLRMHMQLDTPTGLTWDGGIPGKAIWSTVANAKTYTIQLCKGGTVQGDAVSGLIAAEYDFTSAIAAAGSGSYTFRVTAAGDGISYIDSEQSTASLAYNYIVTPNPDGCLVTYQGAQKRYHADSDTYDICFIATINTQGADTVGFVFSKTQTVPTKDNVETTQVKSTSTVYTSIKVWDQTAAAASYGSNFIIACTVKDIPKTDINMPLYVRAFSTIGAETKYTPVIMVTVKMI